MRQKPPRQPFPAASDQAGVEERALYIIQLLYIKVKSFCFFKEIRRINVRRRVSRPGEDISLDNDRAFFYT